MSAVPRASVTDLILPRSVHGCELLNASGDPPLGSHARRASPVVLRRRFCNAHQMWQGGGFGRRLDADMMVPAVQRAKAVGRPVKVIYSRENDMTMDCSRPLTHQKVKAGLDGDGRLVALDHDAVSAWPTKRGGFPISSRLRSTRKGRSTPSQ
jgi:hypothetical protein